MVNELWRNSTEMRRTSKNHITRNTILKVAGVLGIAIPSIFSVSGSTNLTKNMHPNISVAFVDEGIADQFVSRRSKEIARVASEYNVPSELIIATIKNENVYRPRYEDWGDNLGLVYGENISLGIGQVRISTAQSLDKKLGRKFSKEETVARLRDPITNIGYIAMFYNDKMQNLGLDAETVMHQPRQFVDLVARYTGGTNPKGEAKLAGTNALNFLLSTSTFKLSQRSSIDIIEIMREVRDYTFSQGRKQEIAYNGR